jgi:citrate lyase subunit beta / citryl-CoA lyase
MGEQMSDPRRRSWLYVPGDDARKIDKAAASDADVVVLDLEDGCAADRKVQGRARVRAALADIDFGRSLRYVRINGSGSPHWREDVEQTAGAVDGLVLPKASDPQLVHEIAELVRTQRGNGAPPPDLAPIVAEDVEGLFAAERTIAVDELVGTVLWGSEDLSVSLGAWSVRDEEGQPMDVFRLVRSFTLLVAKRHGKRSVDTPYLRIGDLTGAKREARLVARMGFTGKQAIHPEQIPIINNAFLPDEAEIRAARELVAAFEQKGDAVVRHQEAMADAPHLHRALHMLALADDPAGPVPDGPALGSENPKGELPG